MKFDIKKIDFKATGNVLFMIVLAFVLLSFIGSMRKLRIVEVVTNIQDQGDMNFLTDEDINRFIHEEGEYEIDSGRVQFIELAEIEKFLNEHDFVRKADVSRDYKGRLIVNIEQVTPLARIYGVKGQGYISTYKTVLPLYDKHGARVPIITGNAADTLLVDSMWHTQEVAQLFDMLSYIRQDRFWSAQVSQIEVDTAWNVNLYTQVGKQKIIMGTAENYTAKFKKLLKFYKKIAPTTGWNKYNKINLSYSGQIVCE